MKKNIIKLKKIIIVFMIIFIAISINTINYAFVGNFSNFEGDGTEDYATSNVVRNSGSIIINIIRIIAVSIALVMILVVAMKYMISAPGDRADIKKHAVAYVVGAIILFGVTGILTIINNFASTITLGG